MDADQQLQDSIQQGEQTGQVVQNDHAYVFYLENTADETGNAWLYLICTVYGIETLVE